jgi:hypothetical protein
MGEDKYNIVAKYGYEGKPKWFWFNIMMLYDASL